MKKKEETIDKIKKAAVLEFLDKGYAKASLRTICRMAGVTTGAMYFSFENKEALFRSILEPLIAEYEKLLENYMGMELSGEEQGEDLDVRMMKFILTHKNETLIIMEKAEGSCFEDYRVHVEQLMEQSFLTYYKSRLGVAPDEALLRILAKMRLEGCLSIIKGNYDMEYSLYLAKKIGIHAGGGTEKLMQDLLKEVHGNSL